MMMTIIIIIIIIIMTSILLTIILNDIHLNFLFACHFYFFKCILFLTSFDFSGSL